MSSNHGGKIPPQPTNNTPQEANKMDEITYDNDITVYEYTYLGATNTKPARIKLTNTKTGENKTESWNYSMNLNAQVEGLIQQIHGKECIIYYGGEKPRGYYYTVKTHETGRYDKPKPANKYFELNRDEFLATLKNN